MNRFSLAILFTLTPVCLHAASFDCAKAQTDVDKAICSSPDLSAADDKLDQAYHTAQANFPEAAELVRQSERNWFLAAERNCRRHENDYPLADCLTPLWQDRTFFLSGIVIRMGGVLFFYREAWLGKPCDEEDMSTGMAKTDPQSKKAKQQDSDEGLCDFHASWPEAISNAPQWKAWNKALLDEARRFQASQDHDNWIPDHWVHFGDPSWRSDDSEVTVELTMASPTLVVATIEKSYTYAHPALFERAFNWLLKQGCELKQDNLFQSDSGWQAWMKKRVSQTIKDSEVSESDVDQADGEDIASLAANVAVESRNWQVDPAGLKLIFSEDELPYTDAVMMPEVTLPWSDLKPYLNPAFEIPR